MPSKKKRAKKPAGPTIEDWERFQYPQDMKFCIGALFRRGPGSYHIKEVGEILGCRQGRAARVAKKMRLRGWNNSPDPAVIDIPGDIEWLAVWGHEVAPKGAALAYGEAPNVTTLEAFQRTKGTQDA